MKPEAMQSYLNKNGRTLHKRPIPGFIIALGFMLVSCRFHARFHTLTPKLALILETGHETSMKPNVIKNTLRIQHSFHTLSPNLALTLETGHETNMKLV